MTHFSSGILGVVVAVVGVVGMIVFNRQFVRIAPKPKGPAARLGLFQPGKSGRVPIVTVIGVGSVLFGIMAMFIAVTEQPL